MNFLPKLLKSSVFFTFLRILSQLALYSPQKGRAVKTLINVIAILFLPLILNAQTTLGIADGVYVGTGTLKSKSMFVPDIAYSSTRVLQGGIITARTRAALHGMQVGEAQAKLKVQMTAPNKFNMLDLSNNQAVCGSGSCNATSCTFTATVMNGSLTLNETWVPTAAGYNVINASQVLFGIESFYSGQFAPQK